MNSGAASPRSRRALRPVHWRWRIAIAGRRCEISKALRQRSSAIRFPACQRSIGEKLRNFAQAFRHGRPSKGKKPDFKTLANQSIDRNPGADFASAGAGAFGGTLYIMPLSAEESKAVAPDRRGPAARVGFELRACR
jgi:hypothetical protein